MFPRAVVLQFEQSKANLNIAQSLMGVPKESCVCTALQDMDWEALEGLIEVFIDWWTLSYLKPADISKVLEGVRKALKTSGIFVICLPVKLREASRAGPTDEGMKYRTVLEYEALFDVAGFVHLDPENGPRVLTPGLTGGTTRYGQEAIWVLTPKI